MAESAMLAAPAVKTEQLAGCTRFVNVVSGGESSGYGLLTVRENLWMFAQFYGISTRDANRRIGELLAILGISDRANIRSSDLSTGLRQSTWSGGAWRTWNMGTAGRVPKRSGWRLFLRTV